MPWVEPGGGAERFSDPGEPPACKVSLQLPTQTAGVPDEVADHLPLVEVRLERVDEGVPRAPVRGAPGVDRVRDEVGPHQWLPSPVQERVYEARRTVTRGTDVPLPRESRPPESRRT